MAEKRKISLVLADVDGTLVNEEKVLTKRAQAAVQSLHRAGIRFAITSGRPPKGMAMLLEALQLETPIAGFNGGLFVKPDLSIIEQKTVPADVAAAAIKLIRDRGLDVWVYRGNDWLIGKADAPHVAREAWTVKFDPVIVKDVGEKLDQVAKIVGVSDDLDAVAKAEAKARDQFGDHVSAARSQPYYLDVTHPQANKGGVVAYLSEQYRIPPEQIATIGDMPNDVLMFSPSGLSIAMGNASAEVQRAARRVTTSNQDEGFANAVERFVLSR
jgi:Cof subfamily protein (haloacid dehalogenase superfamily)